MVSPTVAFKFSYGKLGARSCHGLMKMSSPATVENALSKRTIHEASDRCFMFRFVIISDLMECECKVLDRRLSLIAMCKNLDLKSTTESRISQDTVESIVLLLLMELFFILLNP